MEPLVTGLWYGLEKNHSYALALVADLSDEQMVLQPAGNLPKLMNHPAWVLSHLNAYRPIVAALINGAPFDDPIEHPFGMKSNPQSGRGLYPPKELLISGLEQGKKAIESALRQAESSCWSRPVPLERWQSRWDCVGAGVPFLLLSHENMHLGQLSAWRRALGLPPVQA
jgi:hypothetical protein